MGQRSATPTPIRAVILDMDGLMLDTESIYKRAWQRAAKDFGYSLEDDFYYTFIGQPLPACEVALVERFGREFPMMQFRNRWRHFWSDDVRSSGIPTKPGLHDFLTFLVERRVPVAVATSSDREYTLFSLDAAGMNTRFDAMVTGDEVADGKPAPDIYLESARRLGIEPIYCAAIEDSDNGVLAANAAGMMTFMVPDIKEPSDEARAAAAFVIGSLREAKELLAPLLAPGRSHQDDAADPSRRGASRRG